MSLRLEVILVSSLARLVVAFLRMLLAFWGVAMRVVKVLMLD